MRPRSLRGAAFVLALALSADGAARPASPAAVRELVEAGRVDDALAMTRRLLVDSSHDESLRIVALHLAKQGSTLQALALIDETRSADAERRATDDLLFLLCCSLERKAAAAAVGALPSSSLRSRARLRATRTALAVGDLAWARSSADTIEDEPERNAARMDIALDLVRVEALSEALILVDSLTDPRARLEAAGFMAARRPGEGARKPGELAALALRARTRELREVLLAGEVASLVEAGRVAEARETALALELGGPRDAALVEVACALDRAGETVPAEELALRLEDPERRDGVLLALVEARLQAREPELAAAAAARIEGEGKQLVARQMLGAPAPPVRPTPLEATELDVSLAPALLTLGHCHDHQLPPTRLVAQLASGKVTRMLDVPSSSDAEIAIGGGRLVVAPLQRIDGAGRPSASTSLAGWIDWNGAQLLNVCPLPSRGEAIALAPDGKTLATLGPSIANEPGRDLVLVDMETCDTRALTGSRALDDGTARLSWHPAGGTLLFDAIDGRIKSVDVRSRDVTTVKAQGQGPSWSPSGERLALHDGNGNVIVETLATGARTELRTQGLVRGALHWSPDGRQLACTVLDDQRGAPARSCVAFDVQSHRITDRFPSPACDCGPWLH